MDKKVENIDERITKNRKNSRAYIRKRINKKRKLCTLKRIWTG